MRSAISVLVLSASVVLAPLPALAEEGGVAKAFAQLEREHAEGEAGLWTTYASGAAAALGWANSMLEARKEPRLYCPPRGVPPNPLTYAEVALSEYKGNKPRYDTLDKYPGEAVALAVVNGLLAKWPCK